MGRDGSPSRPMCKSANRPTACAKVQMWRHFQVPGLGPQVSGTGYQVQVRVQGEIQILNLYPNLNTW